MFFKCITILGVILTVVAIYFPARHARHYDYIAVENVIDELVPQKHPSFKPNLKNCTYKELITANYDIPFNFLENNRKFRQPKSGGEFEPNECVATLKSAIIIPYRNRTEQLSIFINYMHEFLQKQKLHYRIFIVDQNNTLLFNRAKMLNYGAKVAIRMNYDCLILHDVDLIPLNSGNIYGCSRKPRHMSSSLDTFRYNLPYLTLFGGAISILSEQFQQINGMSNLFYGWGGEDDDFYRRLESNKLLPYRFSPEISRYTMLFHKKERASPDRFENLQNSIKRSTQDGLNSLTDLYKIHVEDLFTRIIVQ